MGHIDWNKFVEISRGPFIGMARGMGQSEEEAQDIVQNVYFRMIGREYTPPPGRSLMDAYMLVGFQSVKYEIINNYRRMKFKGRKNVVRIEDRHDAVTPPEYMGEGIVWEEIKKVLSPQQFSFLTAFAAGCPYKEIAQMHNSPIGTVKSQLNHSRTKIRELHLDI